MPNLTTTIEDTSPVIVYSSGWDIGSSTDDVFLERYSQSSYMKTNVSQASASFSFYGNGVQLFGAKRQNYSEYQISIDSKTYPTSDASASDPQGIFQTSLFSTIGLAVGYHTVQMTNVEQETLDLDFITWQTPVGSENDLITVVTSQDSDPSFDYIPPSQWTSNVPNPGMFSAGSGHLTYTAGASVKFSFKGGSAVHLFGPVGPNCAPYSVSLDDASPSNYSPWRPYYRPQQLLFQASNLDAGDHSITVQAETGTNSTVYFAIDYAQVFTTSSNTSGAGLSVAQIVGIVVGTFCGVVLLAAAIFMFRSKHGYSLVRKKPDDRRVVEPFNDLSPATSPPYDTQSFTPQNLKGQLSPGTMVQRFSQQDRPLTETSFSGENSSELTPFPLSPVTQSPLRTPRILDEKRSPLSVGESTPAMTRTSSSVLPTNSGSTVAGAPPDYN